MNALARPVEFATSAPVGRHRFTLEEVLAIQAAGILEGERTELIDGEIVHMPSDGELHQRWTRELNLWLARTLDAERYAFLVNTTLRVGVGWAPSPDFFVYPVKVDEGKVTAENVLPSSRSPTARSGMIHAPSPPTTPATACAITG